MRAAVPIASIALLLSSVSVAWAQSAADYYWMSSSGDGSTDGLVMSFMDSASVTNGTRPSSRRFWERRIYKTPPPIPHVGPVRTTMTLTEVDCRTSEYRNLQTTLWDRDGNFLYTRTTPTEWSLAVPMTVVAYTILLVCSGQNPPNSPWAHMGNGNPDAAADRVFDAIEAGRN
jgi:hypothetical protein